MTALTATMATATQTKPMTTTAVFSAADPAGSAAEKKRRT
jgi:hypothetical protein